MPAIEAFTPDHAPLDGVKKRTRKLSPEGGDRFIRSAELERRGGERDTVGGREG